MAGNNEDATDVPRDASQVLDLYKVAVDSADKVSSRRGSANQFFLTLQTLIVGVPALFGSNESSAIDMTALSAIGIIASVVWWLQLRSYRDLNTAKFEVINGIEAEYFDVKPFSDEWASLRTDKVERWRDRYAELGTAERIVPVVFIALHIFSIIRAWAG